MAVAVVLRPAALRHVLCSCTTAPAGSSSKPLRSAGFHGCRIPVTHVSLPLCGCSGMPGLQGSCICNTTRGYRLPDIQTCLSVGACLRCLLPVQTGFLPKEGRTQDGRERSWCMPAPHPSVPAQLEQTLGHEKCSWILRFTHSVFRNPEDQL